MPSTYSSNLRLELQAAGENGSTWGDRTNVNLELIEDAISGMATINSTGGTYTLSSTTLAADEARCAILRVTGTLVSDLTIIVPTLTKTYVVGNATTGAYTVTVKPLAGTGALIAQGYAQTVFCDGTNVSFAWSIGDQLVLPGAATPSQTAEGSVVWDTDSDLLTVGTGAARKTMVDTDSTQTLTNKALTATTLVLPGAATPSQTAEGSVVWDTDSDLLTVGTGAARKTMVDTDSTQTLTNKTLSLTALTLPVSTSPAQTTEGSIVWDSDDDLLTVGDGTARKTMVDLAATQTLTNKTLTAPVLAGAADVTGTLKFTATTPAAFAIDCSLGNYFTKTATTNHTWSFTNVPASRVTFVTLELTNGGTGTQTWPASVDWPSGVAPSLTTSGVDVIQFVTDDGGTVWRGVKVMGDSK